LEKSRVGVVDVLIALIAFVPWRPAVLIALQLSIVLRTFDAYLKWALPILFVCGPIFAYIRERRSSQALARSKGAAADAGSSDSRRRTVIRLGNEDYELRLY
jgi:hypothetical protein